MILHRPEMNNQVQSVSFVIPCMAEPRLLQQCLASLAAQTYPKELTEIIVVDDASPIPLKTFFEQFQKENASFLTLHYIRNVQNAGRAVTRNRGLAKAAGDIVFFLDVDHTLAEDCLAAIVDVFAADTQADGIISVRANTKIPADIQAKSAFIRYIASRYPAARSAGEMKRWNWNDLPPRFFSTGSIAVSRSALMQVGGFDESFTAYGCEDEDLGIRLANIGVPLKLSRHAYVYDMDDRASLNRVCQRMTEYALTSLPRVLAKHPNYASMTTFAVFECPEDDLPLRSRIFRRALLIFLRPWLGSIIAGGLNLVNSVPAKLQPPAFLYQTAITSFYLRSYRHRLSQNKR